LIPTPPRSPERDDPIDMDLSLDLEDITFPFDANFFEKEDFNPKETFGKTAIGSTVFMSNEVDVLSLVSPFENVSPDHIQS
jgi:hypothetical protein